jgi:protease YdgD
MVGRLSSRLWTAIAFCMAITSPAHANTFHQAGIHRGDVDVSRYPWSAIGKLYNESGSACSGVAIASDKILTAAHCLFNYRTRRFISAGALHFLVGYHKGRYTAHVRIARYDIGPGFDPLRYRDTFKADWAILTTTEALPARVSPLRLGEGAMPIGTKAAIAGYPQDRAHAMTADLDCALGGPSDGGHVLQHTCRGVKGYSGAPILVGAGGSEVRVAGIQIASRGSGRTAGMIALPAQAISAGGRSLAGDDRSAPRAAIGQVEALPADATVSSSDITVSSDDIGLDPDLGERVAARQDWPATGEEHSSAAGLSQIAAP